MSYTQPICNECWEPFYLGMNPNAESVPPPTRVRGVDQAGERCCFCGEPERLNGVYIRVNPRAVSYPHKGSE